jgi:methylated-DNA-[protein]-cysteine S-methyltransferase
MITGLYYSVFTAGQDYGTLVADESGITEFVLPVPNNDDAVNSIRKRHPGIIEKDTAALMHARELIKSYFGGIEADFRKIPVNLSNLTDFTRKVLKAVSQIPYGQTRTYMRVASEIGEKDAARAVGNALNRNPVPVIIPCHRVIQSDGEIGGFSAGLEWKMRLLNIEKILK